MRVVMITSSFPATPDAPVGGVQSAVLSLSRALLEVQPDLDLHVVRCPAERDGIAFRSTTPPYTVHNVRGWQSTLNTIPGFRPRRRLERLVDRIQPDIVHVQSAPGHLDGRKHRAVLTIHGVTERDELFRPVRFRWLRSRLKARMEAPARARFQHVIAIAGYVAQHLEGQLAGRCHFIPNSVEAEFFEHRRSESGPRVFYSGTVIPRKNMHGLIEAIGLLKRGGVDCQLRAAGRKATGTYARHLQALIDKWRVGDRIEFLGNLDRRELLSEMEHARCMVLASFQETLPMAVAEAGAMGIPQVVSPAGGTAEMVINGYSGMLVDARSAASIAGGLRPLLLDAQLAAEFGERARSMAEVYRPETVGRQTLSVYETLLQGARDASE
jgi:glycosyltransferase involved in cell wall biosynthesis